MENMEYLYEVVVQTKKFDSILIQKIYLTLYYYYKDIEENYINNEYECNTSWENKYDLLHEILVDLIEIIQNFEKYSNEDVIKVMSRIVYYQKKYKGLKKIKLVREK